MKRLKKFAADSGGASVVEYALVLGLVVAGVATVLPMLGANIGTSVSTSANAAASSPVAPVAVSDGGNKGGGKDKQPKDEQPVVQPVEEPVEEPTVTDPPKGGPKPKVDNPNKKTP